MQFPFASVDGGILKGKNYERGEGGDKIELRLTFLVKLIFRSQTNHRNGYFSTQNSVSTSVSGKGFRHSQFIYRQGDVVLLG
jgi:hypothetical protein